MNYSPIVIVAGEPKSIFLEIFFKSIKKKHFKSPLILICCKKILLIHIKRYKIKKKIRLVKINDLKKLNLCNKYINLIDVKRLFSIKKNIQINLNRSYINNCIEVGLKIIQKKITHKFINGPINKNTFFDKRYLGMTEFISSKFKRHKIAMLIYNQQLSVCPLTTHLPIKLVPKKITKNLILEKLKIIDDFFKNNFKLKPKIGVTGLNPHCESILEYNEDKKVILPAIELAKKNRINVNGPFSADTIFLKQNRKRFNVILGMYHDQVLSPLKTLYEYDAINITIGLPFLRVSPDHGPNENMINKNLSNPTSLIRAIEFLDKN